MIAKILAGLALPRPESGRLFTAYYEDLIRFNRSQNLISRRDASHRAALLIGESCLSAAAQSINKSEYVVDLGSGAGIPGIPTALWVEGLRVALLERRGSRCDFLRREVRALGLASVEVFERDARMPDDLAGRFDRVLLKAVAAPRDALALARPYLASGGRAVLHREPVWNPAEAGPEWALGRRTRLSAPWLDRELEVFEFQPA